jgi:hypothetical protein
LRGVQVVGEFLVLQTVAKRYLLQLVIMHKLRVEGSVSPCRMRQRNWPVE